MKLAILSDSHGSLDRLQIAFNRFRGAEIKSVLHCGDFLVDGVVEIFAEYPDIQFWISTGNCDVNSEIATELKKLPHVTLQEVIQLEIEGIHIGASHIEGIAQNALKGKEIDIFCHGHTHRAKIEKKEGHILLNPGALTDDGKYFIVSLPDLKLEQCLFGCYLQK